MCGGRRPGTGRLQRTFRDLNTDAEDVEPYQELIRYSSQLGRYQAVDARVRLGLYFPLLRGWREWKV